MLGVRCVTQTGVGLAFDSFGKFGIIRIDVVVQTSGQFRDLAASRLALISRAVEMADASANDKYDNRGGGKHGRDERLLVEQGVSPREAAKCLQNECSVVCNDVRTNSGNDHQWG